MMHSFDPQIAVKVGVNAAILYANISWWCEKNRANGRNIHDGRAWTYNSVRAWSELFPYMTPRQINYALQGLEDAGLVVSGNYNETAYDRTKWYAPSREIHFTNLSNGSDTIVKPIPDITQIKTKRDTYVSLGKDETEQALDAYNEAAGRTGWPRAQKLTQPRISAIRKRLKEAGGLGGWKVALEKAEASDFLTGRRATKNGTFLADLDFLLQPSSFTKLMEGSYDNRTDHQQHAIRGNTRDSRARSTLFDAFQSVAAERSAGKGFDDFGT